MIIIWNVSLAAMEKTIYELLDQHITEISKLNWEGSKAAKLQIGLDQLNQIKRELKLTNGWLDKVIGSKRYSLVNMSQSGGFDYRYVTH